MRALDPSRLDKSVCCLAEKLLRSQILKPPRCLQIDWEQRVKTETHWHAQGDAADAYTGQLVLDTVGKYETKVSSNPGQLLARGVPPVNAGECQGALACLRPRAPASVAVTMVALLEPTGSGSSQSGG